MRFHRTFALASCVLFSSCSSSGADSSDRADASDAEGPGNTHESTTPPGGDCTRDSECGYCGSCRDGVCYEDAGCCATVEQEFGFRCSPPDCWDGHCDDGGDYDIWWEATQPCETPIPLALTTLTLEVEPIHLTVLDVDHDGRGEIITVDADGTLAAWRPDGSLVETLQLPWSALHDLRSLDEHLVATVQTGPGEYAIARIGVEAEGLSVSLGDVEAGDLASLPTIGDFDGDGRPQLTVVADVRLHTWDLDADPAPILVRDLAFDPATTALAAVDLDGDGRSELLSFEQSESILRMYSVASHDLRAELVEELAYGGTYRGFAVLAAPSEPERLAIVMQRPIHGTQWTLLPLVEGYPASLSAPVAFGAPHSHRWTLSVDLDGDGTTEIAVAHDTPEHLLHVYRLHPNGPIDCHTALEGIGLDQATRGDVNGDGIPDLVARDGLELQIWSTQ